jgi:DNA-binding response OmpR family regulator
MLVDLKLPDGDGIGLILRLRAQAQYHDTPIIVVSVDPDQGRDDVRSSRLNVLGWLSKPVDFEHLVQVLKTSIVPDSAERLRILHVDDDHDMLSLVTDALRTTADVVSVDSIEGARHALATDNIDLAVLDISLGAGSGLDLLPDLRDRMIPVLILSAHETDFAPGEQVHLALSKSQASLEGLAAAVRERLAHRFAPNAKEPV